MRSWRRYWVITSNTYVMNHKQKVSILLACLVAAVFFVVRPIPKQQFNHFTQEEYLTADKKVNNRAAIGTIMVGIGFFFYYRKEKVELEE